MHETTTRLYLDKHFKAILSYILHGLVLMKNKKRIKHSHCQIYGMMFFVVNSRSSIVIRNRKPKPVFIHSDRVVLCLRFKYSHMHTQSLASISGFFGKFLNAQTDE